MTLNFRVGTNATTGITANAPPPTDIRTPATTLAKITSNLDGVTQNSLQKASNPSFSAISASKNFTQPMGSPIGMSNSDFDAAVRRINLAASLRTSPARAPTTTPESGTVSEAAIPARDRDVGQEPPADTFDFLDSEVTVEGASTGQESPATKAEGKITESHVTLAKYAEFSPFEEGGMGSIGLIRKKDSNVDFKNWKDLDVGLMKFNLASKFEDVGFQLSPNGMFYNEKTGNSFFVVVKRNEEKSIEINLCFGGLGSQVMIKLEDPNNPDKTLHSKMGSAALKAAISDFLGYVPPAAKEAMEIGNALKEVAGKNNNVTIIGHSHGGGLAQCAAASSGLNAVIFNSRPLGVGVQSELETFKKNNSTDSSATNITAFVTDGDWVASKKGLLGKIASGLSPLTKSKRPASIATNTYELPKQERGKLSSIKGENRVFKKILMPMARHIQYSETSKDKKGEQLK